MTIYEYSSSSFKMLFALKLVRLYSLVSFLLNGTPFKPLIGCRISHF